MDITISSDRRNELLARREVEFAVSHDGATPSRMMIGAKLAAMLNAPESLLVLDSLRTHFGRSDLSCTARIYDNEEAKKRTEPAFLMVRGVPKPKEEAV